MATTQNSDDGDKGMASTSEGYLFRNEWDHLQQSSRKVPLVNIETLDEIFGQDLDVTLRSTAWEDRALRLTQHDDRPSCSLENWLALPSTEPMLSVDKDGRDVNNAVDHGHGSREGGEFLTSIAQVQQLLDAETSQQEDNTSGPTSYRELLEETVQAAFGDNASDSSIGSSQALHLPASMASPQGSRMVLPEDRLAQVQDLEHLSAHETGHEDVDVAREPADSDVAVLLTSFQGVDNQGVLPALGQSWGGQAGPSVRGTEIGKDVSGEEKFPATMPRKGERARRDMSHRLAALLGSLKQKKGGSHGGSHGGKRAMIPKRQRQDEHPSILSVAPAFSSAFASLEERLRAQVAQPRALNGSTIPFTWSMSQSAGNICPGGASPADLNPAVQRLDVPRNLLQPSDSACVAMRQLDGVRQQRVQDLILSLAQAWAENDQVMFNRLLSLLDAEASPSGDPMQRCALHFRRALQARASATGADVRREPLQYSLEEIQSALEGTGSVPTIRIGNEASVALLKSTFCDSPASPDFIHVIGMGNFINTHWVEIFRNFALRPGGPPKRVRVTSVEFLSISWKCLPHGMSRLGGHFLSQIADSFRIPFVFDEVVTEVNCFNPNFIRVQVEETLGVVSNMGMGSLPEESILRSNPRNAFLKWIHKHNPAFVLLNEANSKSTGPFFLSRVKNMLRGCLAYYEFLDMGLPRAHLARSIVEEVVARYIINCVACEGLERYVQYEVLEMWQNRMRNVGFVPMPFGSKVWERIRGATEEADPRLRVVEADHAAQLFWRGNPGVAVSAWTIADTWPTSLS